MVWATWGFLSPEMDVTNQSWRLKAPLVCATFSHRNEQQIMSLAQETTAWIFGCPAKLCWKLKKGVSQHAGNSHTFGDCPKWGVPPVLIHFMRIFHYKPSILGYSHFRKPPIYSINNGHSMIHWIHISQVSSCFSVYDMIEPFIFDTSSFKRQIASAFYPQAGQENPS